MKIRLNANFIYQFPIIKFDKNQYLIYNLVSFIKVWLDYVGLSMSNQRI